MKTVLAIVESQEMGQLLRHALGNRYNLTVCRTADEGTMLLQQKPDALILDLHIPASCHLPAAGCNCLGCRVHSSGFAEGCTAGCRLSDPDPLYRNADRAPSGNAPEQKRSLPFGRVRIVRKILRKSYITFVLKN